MAPHFGPFQKAGLKQDIYSLLSPRLNKASGAYLCVVSGLVETSKVSLHSYRFVMAERLEEGGASVEDRMGCIGHADYEMSEPYSKGSSYVPQCVEIINGAKAA